MSCADLSNVEDLKHRRCIRGGCQCKCNTCLSAKHESYCSVSDQSAPTNHPDCSCKEPLGPPFCRNCPEEYRRGFEEGQRQLKAAQNHSAAWKGI
jgi:hypothetical protein